MSETRISNVRKKELKQPDPFLESIYKGMEVLKQFKKQLVLASVVIVAIICIVSGTVYSIHSSETRASEILVQVLEDYGKMEPSKGYDAVKDTFSSLIEEYPNTSSGQIGRIRFAGICYDAGKYDSAFDLYTSAMSDFKNDPVVRDILLLSLGHTCQAQNKTEDAEKYFTTLTEKGSALMKDEALFNLGMLAIKSGDKAKGVEFMKKISSEHEGSMYKSMADGIVAQN